MDEELLRALLGREPVQVDLEEIFGFLRDKSVLITGGGGSIGGELARQIAAHQPRRLILFDICENPVYLLQQELKRKFPQLDLVVRIGSVRDFRRLMEVFSAERPQVVYHAAAHKHVPLMEESPCEAIKNNTLGTYQTAYAALCRGCERFVLISTDKAVYPTSVMGASKRLCELVIQSFDRMRKAGTPEKLPQLWDHGEDFPQPPKDAGTEFVAVRFGNVLGSSGSVLPLFQAQIAAGGPVMVTHPEVNRYFMTIQEAVSLVLQAGVYAQGGEIFVFDMGEPVKIDTLARRLIQRSGLRPEKDIPIVYTGLQPGEKLYEERLMAEEGLGQTPNAHIHVGAPLPFDTEGFLAELTELIAAARRDCPDIRERIKKILPAYHPAVEQDRKTGGGETA